MPFVEIKYVLKMNIRGDTVYHNFNFYLINLFNLRGTRNLIKFSNQIAYLIYEPKNFVLPKNNNNKNQSLFHLHHMFYSIFRIAKERKTLFLLDHVH